MSVSKAAARTLAGGCQVPVAMRLTEPRVKTCGKCKSRRAVDDDDHRRQHRHQRNIARRHLSAAMLVHQIRHDAADDDEADDQSHGDDLHDADPLR